MQPDLFDKTDKALSPLQMKQVQLIVTQLANMGCLYIIKLPDGQVLRNAAVKSNKTGRSRSRSIHKFGEVRDYLKTYLDNIQPGQVVYIPAGKFTLKQVQSGSASYLNGK